MFQKRLAGKSAVILGLFLVILVSGTPFASGSDKNQALREACEKGNLEDVCQRHHRVNDGCVTAHLLPQDLAAAAGEIADHAANVVFRRHHLDLHDGLKQLRSRLLRTLAESSTRSDPKASAPESTS